MFAPVTYFQHATLIERRRVLPGPAKILVRKGQTVAPDDVVAEDLIGYKHLHLDIARGLSVSPERADELVQCKTGAAVVASDILAGPIGLTRRVVRAPQAGKVVYIGQGRILLELTGSPLQLKAGVMAEVVDLIPERGVILQTYGALVQGVWGNGRIGQGDIRLLSSEPEVELNHQDLKDQWAGSILAGDYCSDPTIFKIAAQMSVKGIVLASMHPALVPLAMQSSLPVILIEGFGRHPMNAVAHEILATYDGLPAALNAETWDVLAESRPELIIPHDSYQEGLSRPPIDFFAPGKRVRIIGLSRLGQVGTLVDLVGEVTLPNGLRAASARIQLENGETPNIPLANLELLV
jgi:hypothetical protein